MPKKKQTPTRVTLDLAPEDYLALGRVVRELQTVSQADALRRLVRYAAANPQLFNARTL
jgi:hypothetical protein